MHFFSFSEQHKRMGRLSYLMTLVTCCFFGFAMAAFLLFGLFSGFAGVSAWFLNLFFLFIPILMAIFIIATLKRINDVQMNNGLIVLLFIPFVNIAFITYLILKPGVQSVQNNPQI